MRGGEGLAEELSAMQTDQPVLLREARKSGQVSFMKGFMRVFPDFDWSMMGEGAVVYVADLKEEMVEEESVGRVEEEAARSATENELHTDEATRTQDDQNPPVDPY